MNLWQRLIHRLFGTQYVVLENANGSFILRRAYKLGGLWYSHDLNTDSLVRLMPAGRTTPTYRIVGWHPVTSEVQPSTVTPFRQPRCVSRPKAEAR